MRSGITVSLFLLATALCAYCEGNGFVESGSVLEHDEYGDGTIESRTITSNVYDHQGKLVKTLASKIDPEGNQYQLETTTWLYDKHEGLIGSMLTVELDGEPFAEATMTHTNLSRYQTLDVFSSVVLDDPSSYFTETIVTTVDEHGRPQLREEHQEYGFGKYLFISSWDYNFKEHQVIITTKGYHNDEEAPSYLTTTTQTLNSQRLPIFSVAEADLGDNRGKFIAQQVKYVYGKEGILLEARFQNLGYVDTVSYSYVSRGEQKREGFKPSMDRNGLPGVFLRVEQLHSFGPALRDDGRSISARNYEE